MEEGATGYAVTWKSGQTWRGYKVHMGWEQEAYGILLPLNTGLT